MNKATVAHQVTEKEVFSVNYYSQRGRCFVIQLGSPNQSRPFLTYFHDQGKEPRIFETHSTRSRAEASARWMAMGL